MLLTSSETHVSDWNILNNGGPQFISGSQRGQEEAQLAEWKGPAHFLRVLQVITDIHFASGSEICGVSV